MNRIASVLRETRLRFDPDLPLLGDLWKLRRIVDQISDLSRGGFAASNEELILWNELGPLVDRLIPAVTGWMEGYEKQLSGSLERLIPNSGKEATERGEDSRRADDGADLER